jgi:hypothetical protein
VRGGALLLFLGVIVCGLVRGMLESKRHMDGAWLWTSKAECLVGCLLEDRTETTNIDHEPSP